MVEKYFNFKSFVSTIDSYFSKASVLQKAALLGAVVSLLFAFALSGNDSELEKAKRIAGYDYEKSKAIEKMEDEVSSLNACKANVSQSIGKDEPVKTCQEYLNSTMGGSVANAYSDVKKEPEEKREEGKSGKPLEPSELFYTTKVSDGCHVSQTEEEHFLKKNGGVLATDVACRFGNEKAQRAMVFAPDSAGHVEYYKVTKIANDKLLGNYVQLDTDGNLVRWVIAHVETKLKEGDVIRTGDTIGQMDLSGATTGYHTHVELWYLIKDKWTNVSYSTRSQSLENRRNGKFDTTVKKGDKLYFTTYTIGDVSQNDSSPFIGASGRDLRNVTNPIALTNDVRNLYGIKFGEKVKLDGKCGGTYSVEDEMNIRYRSSCVNKEGACIKGDIGLLRENWKDCSGVYSVTKL